MVLLSLWTCAKPFDGLHVDECKGDIIHPQLLDWLIPKDCPKSWATLIRQCCAHDPQNRPSSFQQLAHHLEQMLLSSSYSPSISSSSDEEIAMVQMVAMSRAIRKLPA